MKMNTRETLFDQFLVEYHKPKVFDMATGIKYILSTPTFYYPLNKDWQYLDSQMKRLISEFNQYSTQELPGMVYGMFYTAFSYLVDYILAK